MAQLYLNTALRLVKDHMEYSWAVFSLGHEWGGALRQWSVILQWRNMHVHWQTAASTQNVELHRFPHCLLSELNSVELSPWLLIVITDVDDGFQSSTGTSHWRTTMALFCQWISQQLSDSSRKYWVFCFRYWLTPMQNIANSVPKWDLPVFFCPRLSLFFLLFWDFLSFCWTTFLSSSGNL